jgi:hypothetical protein
VDWEYKCGKVNTAVCDWVTEEKEDSVDTFGSGKWLQFQMPESLEGAALEYVDYLNGHHPGKAYGTQYVATQSYGSSWEDSPVESKYRELHQCWAQLVSNFGREKWLFVADLAIGLTIYI